MASLTLTALSLTYPNKTRAVDEIHLAIADGEFLAILGPSGCGKSSLLRLVAGLEIPTSGSIAMDGRDVTRLEPKDRDVAMVFQGLALYPHMTVSDNMAFGLMARRTPPDEIALRVREAAETLGLTAHLAKRPARAFGGRTPAGRAGPRAGAPPEDLPLRRAPFEPRRAASPGAARGAGAAPPRSPGRRRSTSRTIRRKRSRWATRWR